MPGFQPDLNDIHVDKLLTTISIGYKNDLYINEQVAPVVLVEKESDIIPQYIKDFWFRDIAQRLAPGDKAPRSGFTVDNTLKYDVQEYGIAKEIPDRLRANQDAPYDLDRDAAMWVAEMIALRWEVQFGSTVFSTSVWDADVTPAPTWDDYGLSDPIADIRTQRRVIRTKIARPGNTLILGEDVMDTLIDHPLLVERVKYSGGDVTEDLIKRLLRVDKVLVGTSMQATNLEGVALALSDLFTKQALIMYLPASPGRFTPSAVYNFVQKPFRGGDRMVTRRIRNDERMIDIVEGRTAYDMKIIDADAGVFFDAVIA